MSSSDRNKVGRHTEKRSGKPQRFEDWEDEHGTQRARKRREREARIRAEQEKRSRDERGFRNPDAGHGERRSLHTRLDSLRSSEEEEDGWEV